MIRIIAAERRDIYSYESPLFMSAKSEMLSISLFAEEVRRPCTFYKHYVPTARYCPDSLASDYLRQQAKGRTTHEIDQRPRRNSSLVLSQAFSFCYTASMPSLKLPKFIFLPLLSRICT